MMPVGNNMTKFLRTIILSNGKSHLSDASNDDLMRRKHSFDLKGMNHRKELSGL